MKDLLNKLIKEAPSENEGAAQTQLQIGAMVHAGALRHSPDHKGFYELLTLGQTQDRKIFAISVIFRGEDVTAVIIPRGEQTQLVETPKRGIIIPGAQ